MGKAGNSDHSFCSWAARVSSKREVQTTNLEFVPVVTHKGNELYAEKGELKATRWVDQQMKQLKAAAPDSQQARSHRSRLERPPDFVKAHSGSQELARKGVWARKEEMDDLTHEAEQMVTQAQKAAKEQAGNEWKEWVDEALVGGAGKTHRFAQEPKGWTPTVTVQDGKEAADPSSLC